MSLSKSYVKYNPGTGSGRETISVWADKYTGRLNREEVSLEVIYTKPSFDDSDSDNDPVTQVVKVTQMGKTEYVSLSEGYIDTVSVDNTTELIKLIYATTNSSKLTISVPTSGSARNTLGLTSSAFKYKVSTVSSYTNNGAVIPGDPGASCEQPITIQISQTLSKIAAPGEKKVCDVTVKDAGGHTQTVTLIQTGDSPTITVSTKSITIPAAGTAQTFTIESNTSWEIK